MNEHLKLVLSGVALMAVSGLPGMIVAKRHQAGQAMATLACVMGCVFGLVGALGSLAAGEVCRFSSSEYWHLPLGNFTIELDTLTCVFLLPVFLITLTGSLYGLGYWRHSERPDSAARVQFFYGLLAAAAAGVTLARDGVLFLIVWQIMGVSAFMLVGVEDQEDRARSAAWRSLAASYLAALALIGMFSLLNEVTGSFAFAPVRAGVASSGQLHAIFFLALLGFGLAAGIMPLHAWLPAAHAAAPSHVAAMLSGVTINLGVYGLIRITGLLPDAPLAWGYALIALGAVSGIVALSKAMRQLELPRALAYGSIENIGVIFMGLGLALCGRAQGEPVWIALGLGGALLLAWSHALCKSALFYCAGSVTRGAKATAMNLMGGLAKPMRWTSLAFLIGSVGACALPPLGGFVGVLLIWLGFLRPLVDRGAGGLAMLALATAALSTAALAIIGVLGLALHARLFGTVFLGVSRSRAAQRAQESPNSMLVPLAPLLALMLLIGAAPMMSLAPNTGMSPTAITGMPRAEVVGMSAATNARSQVSVIGVIQRAVDGWAPRLPDAQAPPPIADLTPLGWLGGAGMVLAGLIAAVCGWHWWRLRPAPVAAGRGRKRGSAAPVVREQPSPAGVGRISLPLWNWIVRPPTPAQSEPAQSVSNQDAENPSGPALTARQEWFRWRIATATLARVVDPVASFGERLLAHARRMQPGVVPMYLLSIVVMIVVLLIWS